MKISVLGCGRWGSCIAWYLDKIGHDVMTSGLKDAPEFIQLQKRGKNDYLTFPPSIELSSDLGEAVAHAEVIVISISSQHLRSYMTDIAKNDLDGKIIVLCMKGVEVTTGKRLSQVVGDFVDESKTPVAVWVGPGHPQDYVRGIPNCMVVDSANQEVKKKLVRSFNSELIRFYLGTDLIGSEIGAAAKNVIGIAAGILDGLGYTSLKGRAYGKRHSEKSRADRSAGRQRIQRIRTLSPGRLRGDALLSVEPQPEIRRGLGQGHRFEKLAEGVMTSKALFLLGQEYDVDLPLSWRASTGCSLKRRDVRERIKRLFGRSVKENFKGSTNE